MSEPQGNRQARAIEQAWDDLCELRERLDKALDEIEDRILDHMPANAPPACPVMTVWRRFWGFLVGTVTGWKGNIPS